MLAPIETEFLRSW